MSGPRPAGTPEGLRPDPTPDEETESLPTFEMACA